jgi:hypothetical protein
VAAYASQYAYVSDRQSRWFISRSDEAVSNHAQGRRVFVLMGGCSGRGKLVVERRRQMANGWLMATSAEAS